jgi:hypothetical protein
MIQALQDVEEIMHRRSDSPPRLGERIFPLESSPNPIASLSYLC